MTFFFFLYLTKIFLRYDHLLESIISLGDIHVFLVENSFLVEAIRCKKNSKIFPYNE